MRFRTLSARGIALAATFVFVLGCGGSGGGSSSGDFEPNYADLVNLAHWPVRPVTVAFHTDGTYDSTYRSIALDAFDTWFDPTDGGVTFEVVGLDDSPDIEVRFRSAADPEDPDVLGVTTTNVSGNRISHSEVTIGTEQSDADVSRTCVHEFGHAYGIYSGHSDQRSDIMYFRITSTSRPSRRDGNTMRLAYDSEVSGLTRGPARTIRAITHRNSECTITQTPGTTGP